MQLNTARTMNREVGERIAAAFFERLQEGNLPVRQFAKPVILQSNHSPKPKEKTVNDMSPDERFRFEYSLNAANLSAAGISEEDYIHSRKVDWGILSLAPGTRQPDPAPTGNPLYQEAPIDIR